VQVNTPQSAASDREIGPHRLLVPYEWFEQAAFGERRISLDRVLVLWLQDDAFTDAPLARLADLLSWFRVKFVKAPADEEFLPLPGVAVLGPDTSGTLQKMVKEANENPWNRETRECLRTVHIYSSQASAAEAQLLPERAFREDPPVPIAHTCKQLIEQNVRSGTVGSEFSFDRTNVGDDQIANRLWQELRLRGVRNAGDHVVVLSEEDTFYARALSSIFVESRPKVALAHGSASPIDVRWYTYLRGIDGKLPQDEKDDKEAKELTKADNKNTKGSLRPTEQTEGLNQADDIRRLASDLKRLDITWRSNGESLKAVGLLGTDVYDKLELLKALRPILPEAVFFTNHLDARMFHPDELKETHNLIVVSNFDLTINHPGDSPNDKHYQHVAPFRDSGQTALYDAALKAIGKPQAQTVGDPVRIVEIGRDGYDELSVSGAEDTSAELVEVIKRYSIGIIGFVACMSVLLVWAHLVSRISRAAPSGVSNAEADQSGEIVLGR
jgi:hypothetical protein